VEAVVDVRLAVEIEVNPEVGSSRRSIQTDRRATEIHTCLRGSVPTGISVEAATDIVQANWASNAPIRDL